MVAFYDMDKQTSIRMVPKKYWQAQKYSFITMKVSLAVHILSSLVEIAFVDWFTKLLLITVSIYMNL